MSVPSSPMERKKNIARGQRAGMEQTNWWMPLELKRRVQHRALDLHTTLQNLLVEGIELRLALIEGEQQMIRVARGLSQRAGN
jgi:hypothetical protein